MRARIKGDPPLSRAGKLRFLFVPYRWGEDLAGGAERLHRRLVRELVDAGHSVEVWTTTAHRFRPFCHWGALWNQFLPEGDTRDEGVLVRRFRARRFPKLYLAYEAKRVQRAHERLPLDVPDARLAGIKGPLLDTDWHEVEPTPDGPRRWSSGLSHIRLPASHEGGTLVLRGDAPWVVDAKLGAEDGVAARRTRGNFELRAEIPRGVVRVPLRVDGAQRPLRDFRTLGVRLAQMTFQSEAQTLDGDLWRDARAYAKDEDLWAHAQRQPEWMEGSFARLRGPNSPGLEESLARDTARFDVILSANLPWRLYGGAGARGGKPRRVLIPLMHIGDSYYYRRQYLEAMRKADLVAAMTPWAASKVFPQTGSVATFVGAPVWPDERLVRMADARPVRDRSAMKVLTVSRKSPDKRYREIAESAARLKSAGTAVEFIGVGEDIDGAAMPEGTTWRGALGDDALRECWLHADVFVLMSESESFGMVIVEAWHARLPVIANPRCAPVASLIEDGVTGILATPGAELDAALARLARDPELRRRIADAGCARARREFVRGAAAQRLVDALSTM